MQVLAGYSLNLVLCPVPGGSEGEEERDGDRDGEGEEPLDSDKVGDVWEGVEATLSCSGMGRTFWSDNITS